MRYLVHGFRPFFSFVVLLEYLTDLFVVCLSVCVFFCFTCVPGEKVQDATRRAFVVIFFLSFAFLFFIFCGCIVFVHVFRLFLQAT